MENTTAMNVTANEDNELVITEEEREPVAICNECGEPIFDDGVDYQVYYISAGFRRVHHYCESCFNALTDDGSIVMTADEEVWDVDDCVWLTDTEEYESRYYGDYYYCDICDNYYSSDTAMHEDIHGNSVCENCCNDLYTTCYECGEIIGYDEAHEYHDHTYCERCYDEYCDNLIGRYENTNYDPVYDREYFRQMSSEDTVEYFGVELEVEEGERGDLNEAAYEIDEITSDVSMKHDGSLKHYGGRSCGFEIVSPPCTLEYHKQRFPWNQIQTVCRNNGMVSHDSDNCGLHIHVSREAFGEDETTQCLHIAILLMLQKRFATKFHKFSRRDAGHYCYDNDIDIDKNDNFKVIKEKYNKEKSNRYYQINVENEHTVEFRCFKGTLVYETLIASLEFAATLVRYSTQITIADIESVQWEDIFANTEYPTLKKYMISRGLL